jgi:hypothetical protein
VDKKAEILSVKKMDFLRILEEYPVYEEEFAKIAEFRQTRNKTAIISAKRANIKLSPKL